MNQETVKFKCGEISLEGVFAFPAAKGPFGVVIICHPHPLYGGSMNNNVVDAVCKGVAERKLAWLKFNFRGVGRSGGSYAGGLGERADLKAAISLAVEKTGIDAGRIGVCGYSFGSLVAFAVAAEEQRVRAVAGISPFLEPATLLNNYLRPKLFICGTNDEFINTRELEKLVHGLPEPKVLITCPGVDHFWWGQEDKIAEKVGEFFAASFLRCLGS